MSFISGASSRVRDYVANAAAAAGGVAAQVAGGVYHAAATAGGRAAAAASGAAAAVTSRAARAAIQVGLSSQLPQHPTPIINKATDLLHLISKASRSQVDAKLLGETIVDLATALRSGGKTKEASNLENEQRAIQAARDQGEQKAAASTAGVASSAADGPNVGLSSERIKTIHDLCLSVISKELCREVRACLKWKPSLFREEGLSQLESIYKGSVYDLPVYIPAYSPVYTSDSNMTLLELALDDDPRIVGHRAYKLIINSQLSEFYKTNLIEMIISARRHDFISKIFIIQAALDKEADPLAFEQWCQTPQFREELIEKINNEIAVDDSVGSAQQIFPCVEAACLHGFDVRAKEQKVSSNEQEAGSKEQGDSFFQQVNDQLRIREMKRTHLRNGPPIALRRFFELAIDFGADLSEAIPQEKIDKIQEFLRGKGKNERIDDKEIAGFLAEQNEGNEEWESRYFEWQVELVRRSNLGIYSMAERNVNRFSQHIQSAMVQEQAPMAQEEDEAAADRGQSRRGQLSGEQLQWPLDISKIVASYCYTRQQLITREVKKLRGEYVELGVERKSPVGVGEAADAASAGGGSVAGAAAVATSEGKAASGAACT